MSAEPALVEQFEDAAQVAAGGPQKQDRERERSTIDFAYLGLDVGIEIVRAVHSTGGQQSQIVQAAAYLNEKPNTGAFRNKLATARIFGLATYSIAAGTINLTPLGSRITDPDQEKAARAEAFLHVPLYRRIHEQYNGVLLPPTAAALESAIVSMGVSPKQKEKARQVFQRSAQQAGFFAFGSTKLVYPILNGVESKNGNATNADANAGKKAGNGGDGGGEGGGEGGQQQKKRHPFIEGLLDTLPPVAAMGGEKTEWSLQGRQEWLQTAAGIFNLIFRAEPQEKGSIQVAVDRPTSTYGSAN